MSDIKLGDRVVVEGDPGSNCQGIPFSGLVGTVVALVDNMGRDMCAVLFDRDMCGLEGMENCDHDFDKCARHVSYMYKVLAGAIVPGKRNQRFFPYLWLKRIGANATGVEPRNNDGRTACFWCGAPTKNVPGISVNNYDVCTKCDR